MPWRFSAAGRLTAWIGLHPGGRKPAHELLSQVGSIWSALLQSGDIRCSSGSTYQGSTRPTNSFGRRIASAPRGVWSQRRWPGAGCISSTDPELISEDPRRTVQPQVWRPRDAEHAAQKYGRAATWNRGCTGSAFVAAEGPPIVHTTQPAGIMGDALDRIKEDGISHRPIREISRDLGSSEANRFHGQTTETPYRRGKVKSLPELAKVLLIGERQACGHWSAALPN